MSLVPNMYLIYMFLPWLTFGPWIWVWHLCTKCWLTYPDYKTLFTRRQNSSLFHIQQSWLTDCGLATLIILAAQPQLQHNTPIYMSKNGSKPKCTMAHGWNLCPLCSRLLCWELLFLQSQSHVHPLFRLLWKVHGLWMEDCTIILYHVEIYVKVSMPMRSPSTQDQLLHNIRSCYSIYACSGGSDIQ